jgi:hypothetical protein
MDRASFRERWSELSNFWYRAAGINVAQHRVAPAIGYLALAVMTSPVRTVRRLGHTLGASSPTVARRKG